MSTGESKIERGTTSPKHTLEEAIGFLETLDKSYSNRAIGREGIAEALGHSPSSSVVAVKIGSLVHYGLLKREGSTYRQSKLAREILFPTSDESRRVAIVQAARSPSLYRRIFADFGNKAMPSMLENILLRDYGVAKSNAADVVKTFKSTATFANLLDAGVIHIEPVEAGDGENNPEEDSVEFVHSHINQNPQEQSRVSVPASNEDVYAVPLTKHRVASLRLPRPLTGQDIQRLKSWLDLMTDVLTESENLEDQET